MRNKSRFKKCRTREVNIDSCMSYEYYLITTLFSKILHPVIVELKKVRAELKTQVEVRDKVIKELKETKLQLCREKTSRLEDMHKKHKLATDLEASQISERQLVNTMLREQCRAERHAHEVQTLELSVAASKVVGASYEDLITRRDEEFGMQKILLEKQRKKIKEQNLEMYKLEHELVQIRRLYGLLQAHALKFAQSATEKALVVTNQTTVII